jgi:hypothetical protein
MSARSATLRSKLLRWLLIPLSLLFLIDAVGSYYIARHVSDSVYDGELLEIARELTLHVRANGGRPSFDLEKDAERTLLLDQYDQVDYVVRGPGGDRIAGDARLPAPPRGAVGATTFFDSELDGRPIRVVQLQSAGGASATVRVAETRVKRHALVDEIMVGVILPQLLLIVIAGVVLWAGVAHGLAPLAKLRQAVAARTRCSQRSTTSWRGSRKYSGIRGDSSPTPRTSCARRWLVSRRTSKWRCAKRTRRKPGNRSRIFIRASSGWRGSSRSCCRSPATSRRP